MRDSKALQAGTSHMLGQNFANAAGIEFLDRDNQLKAPYGTSWGFSTRMVGATIMAHGDDSGLVLPPNVAPTQLVIVPIFRNDDERAAVAEAVETLEKSLARRPDRVRAAALQDRLARRESPGFKYSHWELRGVPFRLEIGPRDVAAGQGVLVRRVDRDKQTVRARRAWRSSCRSCWPTTRRRSSSARSNSARPTPTCRHVRRVQGGARQRGRLPDGAVVRRSAACEKQVNADTGATIRVIPFEFAR